MEQAGVNLKGSVVVKESNHLKNLTFVITGSFSEYSRSEISALIESHSGRVSSTVSKKTNYLVAGEEAGSKLIKAETLGINIIGIEQLLEMINKNNGEKEEDEFTN